VRVLGRARSFEFRNTRAYARASLKSHRRWLAHCDSRRDRAANRLDHVTLTPGAAVLAVATDTRLPRRPAVAANDEPHETVSLRFASRPGRILSPTASRSCFGRPRFDPLANYAKLGDGVGAISRRRVTLHRPTFLWPHGEDVADLMADPRYAEREPRPKHGTPSGVFNGSTNGRLTWRAARNRDPTSLSGGTEQFR
jgi:hypothetical protein